MDDIKKLIEKYGREKCKRGLWNSKEEREIKRWREENESYNRQNKKNIVFAYELRKNNRYTVNKGVHNEEYNREKYGDGRAKTDVKYKRENKIVFLYGEDEDKIVGVIKTANIYVDKKNGEITHKIKIKDIPEYICGRNTPLPIKKNIEVNGEKVEYEDLAKLFYKHNVEFYRV